MALTVKLDKIDLLEANERHGALRRLVRKATLSGTDLTSETDWQALTTALDEDATLPQYNDHLTEDLTSNAYDLVLVERNIKMIDRGYAEVELVYENWVDLPENLDTPRGGYVTGEVRCNIQQKTSNLDLNGNLVEVEHTYPADDPNHASETLVQGVEFQYYEPERTVNITGIKQTRTPWLIANAIIGRVNSGVFSGEAPRKWLCTGCTWKIAWAGRMGASARENRYYMTFEFQFNADTWDPTVVFIDDFTNKPPPDLVPNVGYKTVTKMPAVDYNSVLGVILQGG
jgi:hypothetical protein